MKQNKIILSKAVVAYLLILVILPFFVFTSCNDKGRQARAKDTNTIGNAQKPDDTTTSRLPLDKIKLPKGFKIELYADIPNARSLALSPDGTLFVGNRSEDKVYAITDKNKDGTADKVFVIAENMNTPNGVAFKDGNLYVAEIDKIWKFENIEQNLESPPKPILITDKFPTDKHHGWKFIAFSPEGKLYVPVGAPCNICEGEKPIYASITKMNPDGSDLEIFAEGIRNSVGFDWHPQTGDLWFTENGRDRMNDTTPADELNYAPKKGLHFGYPYCHAGDVKDPKFGDKRSCEEFVPPVQKLVAHTAALGMRFYTENQFPQEYKNQIFIAEHGSWNRSNKVGYRITLVKLEGNKAISYEPFATGWLEGEENWGRPVDVIVNPEGALLVSDDYAGAVYKISYQK
ncbi:sorbosone dehydrogenase family protein [Bernardetia sp. Wsw4-3y2]|uniref:PQQ-dependent sugar dehydrogenase n=1 Tax=Bernardetia sp. Wsw4-3y2 TaxID=3127471 RepID=UPI0030CDE27C